MSKPSVKIIATVVYECDPEDLDTIAIEINGQINNYGQVISHVGDFTQVNSLDLSDK